MLNVTRVGSLILSSLGIVNNKKTWFANLDAYILKKKKRKFYFHFFFLS